MGSDNQQDIQDKVNQTIKQAQQAIASGDQNTAVLLLDQVLSQHPDHPDANYQSALIDLEINGSEVALKKFEKAVTNKPQSESHWIGYIETLMESASLEIVLEALELGQQYALTSKHAQDLAEKFLAEKHDAGNVSSQQHEETSVNKSDQQTYHEASSVIQNTSIENGQDGVVRNASDNTPLMVLIPAYRAQFIPELLASLLVQTYKKFKVIISDDNPDKAVTKLLNDPSLEGITSKLEIEVIEGPKKGVMSNIVNLTAHCPEHTKYVHVLFDDDIIYPLFYEEHMAAHSQPNVGLSVSQRWKLNESSFPYDTFQIPAFLRTSPNKLIQLGKEEVFKSVLPNCANWLGEFSNCVYRFDCIQFYCRSRLANIPYYGLGDIGAILDVALENKVAFIKEHLSGFRQHDSQFTQSQRSKVFKCGVLAWIALGIAACNLGQITEAERTNCINIVFKTLHDAYQNEEDLQVFLSLEAEMNDWPQFEASFLREWEKYIQVPDWVNAKALSVL